MKSLKNLSLALLLLTMATTAANAQTNETVASEPFSYVPTPQTKAFMRYGNNAVNMNTGTVTLNIPVYTYTDNDFEIPVSVTYLSQGLMPGNQTGILGLGWFLNCGGTVSREIVGVPDDCVASNNINGFLNGASFSENDVININKKYIDTETLGSYAINGRETTSDVYHFSFNGYSGTFHFDSYKQPHVYNTGGNHGTYTITPIKSQNLELIGFVIMTGDGYEYTFGNNENAVERNLKGKITGNAVFTFEQPISQPIVTWNLTGIKAPNGRTVTFDYQTADSNIGTYINSETKNNPFLVTSFVPSFLMEDNSKIDHSRSVSVVRTSYLSKVTIDGDVEFRFSMSLKGCYDRPATVTPVTTKEQDHFITQNLKKLDSFEVRNAKGEKLHFTKFKYRIKNNRLILDNVHTDGIGDYHMSYYEENPFPPISTSDIDFWGFYNGKGNSYDVVSSTKVDDNHNDYIETDAKNPDWRYSRLGCLKHIAYPTKGFSTFEYEPNRAQKILLKRDVGAVDGFKEVDDEDLGLYETENEEEKVSYLVKLYPYNILFDDNDECGGIRVARTADYDNYRGSQSRSYIYTGGVVYSFPKHYAAKLYSYQIYNPTAQYPANSLDKQHICYSAVHEILADGTYTITRYNDYNSHPDEYEGQVRKKVIDIVDGLDIYNIYSPSFINNVMRIPNSNHAKRGKVKAIEYYSREGELMKRTTYDYEMHDTCYTSYIVMSGLFANSVKRYTGDYRLVRVQENEYFDGGCISSRQTFSYDDKGRVVCRTSELPVASRIHTYTQYHNDTLRHVFSLPSNIIKIKERDSVMLLTEAQKYDYRTLDNMCLLQKISNARIRDNVTYPCDTSTLEYAPKQRIVAYDNLGNPTEIVDEHEVHTAVLWGYGGKYPVVKACGITIAELMSLVGKTDNTPIKAALTDKQRQAVLDNTKTALVDIYEYKPHVGVIKHYSSDGRCIEYNYDSYGRLITISDNEGVLQEFNYYQASN